MSTAATAELGVIGGGAAATAVWLAAAARLPGAQVLWVAPAGADGTGVAYGTTDPTHRLNVRALRMSARADLPGDFVDFLRQRDGGVDELAFYPRADYGDYLRARLQIAWAGLAGRRWSQRAVAVTRDSAGWNVYGADGECARVRQLVLALGPQPQCVLPGVAAEALASGRYRLDPYAGLPVVETAPAEIWIIGSGLTAVDLALSAAQRYPAARLHLLSRHAALPGVHGPHGEAGADLLDGAASYPRVSALMRQLRQPRQPGEDWRLRVDSLRARCAERWQRWPCAERRRFLRHARWLWDVARHRMAPEVADALAALRQAGRLVLHAGRLRAVTLEDDALSLRWQPRGHADAVDVRADWVLQATGLNTGVARASDPLLRSLLDQGLARADDLDLGLATDAAQRLLGADGRPHQDAYVLGALARGSRFECIAMPEIRTHAAAIVAAVWPHDE
ncbi:MAG: FAD/NAD(P)-binding protein [Lysobacterales bacterium]